MIDVWYKMRRKDQERLKYEIRGITIREPMRRLRRSQVWWMMGLFLSSLPLKKKFLKGLKTMACSKSRSHWKLLSTWGIKDFIARITRITTILPRGASSSMISWGPWWRKRSYLNIWRRKCNMNRAPSPGIWGIEWVRFKGKDPKWKPES